MLRKAIVTAAALSLTATPVLAQSAAPSAAPAAAPAGVTAPEPGSETVQGSELRRGYLLPLLGLTALVLAILALTHTWPFDRDEEAVPTSP